MKTKFCPDCKEERPIYEFFNGNSANGLQHYCKKHQNVRACLWSRKRNIELREQVFDKLGHKCSRCGFSDKRALQIDHVNGDGYKERQKPRSRTFMKKVLADTSGAFQILCANCNWIKRSENKEQKPIIHNGV